MDTVRRDFDMEADSWDGNQARVKLSQDIASAISQKIILRSDMDVLDFGCGTGLISLQLQPRVKSVTGVDTSLKMLDKLREKILNQHLSNIRVLPVNPDVPGDVLNARYHLVVTSMTLHHIEHVTPLLRQFHDCTAHLGHLCVADLDLDDGQFHGGNNAGIFHFGFDRMQLRREFAEAGFSKIHCITAAAVEKPLQNGQMRRFTVFLMIGQKQ